MEAGCYRGPGVSCSLNGTALVFSAGSTLHAVLNWSRGNRFTLVAFSIGQHAMLSSHDRSLLADLGLNLPPAPLPP